MSKFLRLSWLFLLIQFFSCERAGKNALPEWFTATFKTSGLDKEYDLNPFLKPAYLQADFDGDSSQDLATLIIEKATRKKGILLIQGKTLKYYIFGAGTNFGDGSDNFDWATDWALYSKKFADEIIIDNKTGDILESKKILLRRPGIFIEETHDAELVAGGIIYWDGKKYIWIHQGE